MDAGFYKTLSSEREARHKGGAVRRPELAELLGNSDVTKLDLMQMEARLYERASFTGNLPESKRRVKRQARARATERLWDWQGEYWADEVGYYKIDTKPECPENMTQGG